MRAVKGIFIVIALLSVTPQARADDVAVKMFLKKGDRQYKKRTDPKAVDKAKSYYEKVLAVDPDNVKARWKLARLFYWKGTHAKGKAAKMKIFEQGIRYAQEGIQKNSKSIGCHYWLGVSYGKFGEAKGILASLDLVPHLKKEMETVLKLKEGYEYGGAHRVLGRLYYKLPGIKGGDNDKAVKHLKKATKIAPNNLKSHLFLAEVYIAQGKKAEAKKELQFIIDFPEANFIKKLVPESKEEKKQAAKMMAKHFG